LIKKFERTGASSILASGAKALAVLVFTIAAASLLSTTATGTVVGTLLTGSSGTVTATWDMVYFSYDSAANGGSAFACTSSPETCDSDVSSGTALTFAGCSSGTLGTAGCLSTQEGIYVEQPIGPGSVGDTSFLTFANNANLVFSLTGISTYTNTNCASLTVGNSCVIYPGAALLLTLLPNNQTLVSLALTGNATDDGGVTESGYAGGFSQVLTQKIDGNTLLPTPANIQQYFCGSNTVTSFMQCDGGTQSISSSQSGSFTLSSAVPEPSAFALALIGGLLIGVTRIRPRSSKS